MVGPGFSQAVQDIIFFVSIDFRPGHNYIIKAYYSRESGIQLYKVDADYSTRDKKKKKKHRDFKCMFIYVKRKRFGQIPAANKVEITPD